MQLDVVRRFSYLEVSSCGKSLFLRFTLKALVVGISRLAGRWKMTGFPN